MHASSNSLSHAIFRLRKSGYSRFVEARKFPNQQAFLQGAYAFLIMEHKTL